MKNKKYLLAFTIVMGMMLSFITGCKKDEEPAPLKLVSAATNLGVNLYVSTMPTDIPVDASVVLTFDKEINAATATAYTTSLKANEINMIGEILVVGATVTLKTLSGLDMGTTYTVSITPALEATDGAPATATEFAFKTFGKATVAPPQSDKQLSYFPFSGNMKDATGIHSPLNEDIRNLSFSKDRFGFDGSAGYFNGSTTLVELPNADQYMANRSMTVSVWIKADASKNGQFVFGLAAWKGFQCEISNDWSTIKMVTQFAESGGVSDSEDISFAGTGLTKDNGGWQGCTFNKQIAPGSVGTVYLKNKWVQMVYTYDANKQLNTMYLNGEQVVQNSFALWPTTDLKHTISGVRFAGNLTGGGNKLALGFIQGSKNRIITDSWADPDDTFSNHFKGLMDDLRFFKVALTQAEITTLYNAEKPLN